VTDPNKDRQRYIESSKHMFALRSQPKDVTMSNRGTEMHVYENGHLYMHTLPRHYATSKILKMLHSFTYL
jgi:hypothetical protein